MFPTGSSGVYKVTPAMHNSDVMEDTENENRI